jgi:ATP phosphoribosyltransferase regulatory subunit
LQSLAQISQALVPLNVSVGFDLSELRGYHYHSGVVFAAYAQGYKGPLALGGRYDEVGVAFGRARPATGFSLDLRGVATALSPATLPKAILAPSEMNVDLAAKIDSLRDSGEIVIQALPDAVNNVIELNCDRELVLCAGEWVIEFIN